MILSDIFNEAYQRGIGLISITDHDSIDCQEEAKILADKYNMKYVYGLELSIAYSHPAYQESKPISLDFLAYDYNIHYPPLVNKLRTLRDYREKRAEQILERINDELVKENLQKLSQSDLVEIQNSVDGAFGRPHIAHYLVKKGIVNNRQEAFDKYLVRCNVPKMPLSLPEASELVKGAGGKLMLAHPNDPRGTSLVKYTTDLNIQQKIIQETMIPYIDGIECFHSRHDSKTAMMYVAFARNMGLMITGGSDCHQQPVIMGTVELPHYIGKQFGYEMG